tara:strand:+ start:145 stop:435 length:291 start_codon:yes stop_codon:yes gene_type:complete
LAINKSEILNILAKNYPNFLKRDLKKLIEIFLSEIKYALKRHERVELRDVFTLETKLNKARFARNPKTNEKIFVNKKYSLIFKTSKFWSKKINEKK